MPVCSKKILPLHLTTNQTVRLLRHNLLLLEKFRLGTLFFILINTPSLIVHCMVLVPWGKQQPPPAGRQRSSAKAPGRLSLTSPAHPPHAPARPQPSPPLIRSLHSPILIFLINSTLLLMASSFFVTPPLIPNTATPSLLLPLLGSPSPFASPLLSLPLSSPLSLHVCRCALCWALRLPFLSREGAKAARPSPGSAFRRHRARAGTVAPERAPGFSGVRSRLSVTRRELVVEFSFNGVRFEVLPRSVVLPLFVFLAAVHLFSFRS